MKAKKPTTLPIRELPNPGPGLFTDGRSEESVERAFEVASTLVAGNRKEQVDRERLRLDLLKATRTYWADHDHDHRLPLVDVRDDVAELGHRLAQVREALTALSPRARQHLTAEIMNRKADAGPSLLATFEADCIKLARACAPISQIKGSRGSSVCVLNCCARLIEIRERLDDRAFAWSLDAKLEDTGSATKDFKRPDAQFVLKIMQAIDSKTPFERVRSALTELRKGRPGRKGLDKTDE